MLTLESNECAERPSWGTLHPAWTDGQRRSRPSLRIRAERCRPRKSTGGLVGHVLDPAGQPLPARIMLRDARRTVVRECYPSSPRPGHPGGRFELGDLSPGTYVVEIAAPGHCWEIRPGIAVDAGCDTHLGTIRLTGTGVAALSVPSSDQEHAHGA